ncbi:hypothetical protein Enr17x_40130 [Gimesia fumaroli]|uniref:Uncharacterized protein n=1 Tax=Gimesia fumaroli TaxID=2527976 RepID=A0A518IFU6_9PLAN|nr:hypothetical protein Enr17x_40130 [Gimesia fumaroli]
MPGEFKDGATGLDDFTEFLFMEYMMFLFLVEFSSMLTWNDFAEGRGEIKWNVGQILVQPGQALVRVCHSVVQIVSRLSQKMEHPVQWNKLFTSKIVLKPAGFIVLRCFAIDTVSKYVVSLARDACSAFSWWASLCQVLFFHWESKGNEQGKQMTSCAGFGRLE